MDDAVDEGIAELRAAQPVEAVHRVGAAWTALECIRRIVDEGPRAYDIRDIKAVLAEVLGPFAYRERKPCP